MTKTEAVQMFGTAKALAEAVGLSRGRISQWPEKLDQRQEDLVVGAAYRLGILPRPDNSARPG